MSTSRIAVVDYKAGNLTSVAMALRHLGKEPLITHRPEEIAAAERIIFPGVGAAGAAMKNLRELGLDEALRDVIERGRPVLGICVGCQVIFDHSEEDAGTDCLGILPGVVKRFVFPRGISRKIPHMGWNEVHFEGDHPVFRNLPANSQFYFVHGYYPEPRDDSVVRGRAVYGDIRFGAAVARNSVVAVQFHTEKSGPPGLRLLDNFLSWNP